MSYTAGHKLNFSLFLIATFCTMINFSASVIILPLYVLELGGTEFLSGLQSTIYFLAAVLFRLYLGPLADTHGRKLPLIIGVFAFAAAPLFFLYSYDFYTLTAARVFQAIGLAAFFSAGSSYTADIAPKNRIGTYMGFYRSAHAMSLLVGPAKAYYIINHWGYDVWFLISMLIGVIGLIFISLIRSTRLPSTNAQETNDFSAYENNTSSLSLMKEVVNNSKVFPVYLGIAISAAGYGSLVTFAVIYITQVSDIVNPGIYFTYFAIASLFANLTVGRISDYIGRSLVAWLCVFSFGISMFMLYLLPYHQLFMLLSSTLAGVGFSGGLLVLIAWLIDTVANNLRATALSIQESTIDMSIALGAFVFGGIATLYSLSISLVVFSLLLIIIPIFMLSGQRLTTN
ncbi:MFS transporter [Desulfuribacillus alkaliarsenatis]|uniref:Major facilitator superfamily (MFS) profile domain-containing protein n=1 Tax=Desulfuribacillus alkaliarsenatis TaxID=766136 RepID=A0A1E5G398_9FIRM|nr:MFS transporter [Desulfuribacillus alkaliarsenatis]OEF97547.1 hypothetical protein BHF68_04900 [Desulfuribacillus alkaliarsenatis]